MGSSCQRSIVIKATPINSLSSTSKSTNLLSNRGKDGAKRPSSKQTKSKEKKTSYQFEYFSQEDQIRLMKFNSLPIRRSLINLDLSVSKLTEINRGSYGIVYKALSNSGTCFAIKVIDKKRSEQQTVNTGNSIGIMTKETEINLLSKLEHKNIVQYYRYEEYDDRYDIYMEYCEDGTIQDQIMKYKKLDENVIRCYLRHILLGLEYLHFKKVAHRDIKSSNILISKGVCKLCDFGLSKDIWKEKESNVNQACSIKGTYNYIAPEIVNQPYNGTLSDIDWFYSDIWSLGITVFQMATGQFPYSENQIYRLLFKPSAKPFEPIKIPVHLSKELTDFIGSCLKIDPHERLSVSQLLKHPFIVGDDTEDWRKDYEEDYEQIVEEDIGDNQQIFGVNGFMNKKKIVSIG